MLRNDYRKSIVNLGKKGSPEGGWKLEFYYKDKTNGGKQKAHKKRFEKKKHADDYLNKLINDYENQNAEGYFNQTGMFAPPETEPIKIWTFRTFAEFYWEEKERTFAVSSRPNRKSEVKMLTEYFEDTPLAAIDLMSVGEFRKYLEQKPVRIEVKVKSKEQVLNPETKRRRYIFTKEIRETPRSSSTVNHLLVRLRAMLQIAENFEFITKVPKFSGIIETANDNKRDKTISFEELDRLVAGVSKDAGHLKILLIALFETGARLCEIKALKRKDISFEHKTAFVLNSKRRVHKKATYRITYLSDYLRQALIDAGVKELNPDEFVFSQTDPKNPYGRARRVSGIDPEFTIKDLRHCLPTNLGKCGVDEMIIERQIGHNIKGLLKTVYINPKADYMVAEFQKYEEFSKRERAKSAAGKN